MNKIKNKFLSLYVIMICSIVSGCGNNEKDELVPSENVIMVEGDTKDISEIETAIEGNEINNEINELKKSVIMSSNEPDIIADGAILVETSTNTILYEKKLHEQLYPASMTKIITTLILLDYFEPDELIQIGSEINEVPWDSSKAGHIVGEMITIENLLRALMIQSGNDSSNVATVAVAKRFKDDQSLSLEECQEIFSNLMNEKAKSLGALNSNFVKAHGYHEDDHYTTPYDLALISIEYLKNDLLARIASETSFSGDGANGMFEGNDSVKTQYYNWRNHNLLITDNQYNYPDAIGIKTGYTSQAGQCVTAATRNDAGEEFIAIIFNSPNDGRWIDGATLFDHAYDDYEKKSIVKKNQEFDTMSLIKYNPINQSDVAILYENNVELYMPIELKHVEYEEEVTYVGDYTKVNKDGAISLIAPLEKGQVIGVAEFFIEGQKVFETNLIVKDDIEKGNIIHYIKNMIGNFFGNLFSFKGLINIAILLFILSIIRGRILRSKSRRLRRYSTSNTYTFNKNISNSRRINKNMNKNINKNINKNKSINRNRKNRFRK